MLPVRNGTPSNQRGELEGGLAQLLTVGGELSFVPYDIAAHVDLKGNYEIPIEGGFPLHIDLFRYTSRRHAKGATWHERLELFTPLDGAARFRMGGQEVRLDRGDVLVVDNLKLHHVVDFPGFDTRVIVISFMPGLVYGMGSSSHDYAFLLPFYTQRDEQEPHVLQAGHPDSAPVHEAMARLLECYFEKEDNRFRAAGCKAFFQEVLYHLARHFRTSEILHWEFLRQQERSMRLKPLFDRIRLNSAKKLSIKEAAALVYMSPPQFMKKFKQTAGMTLVAYLHHVRLANAMKLLKETSLSIAEIANQTGFTDQSYFDRRFKAAFGQSPRRFRENTLRQEPPPLEAQPSNGRSKRNPLS